MAYNFNKGTANQVTVTASTLSIPSVWIAPGSVEATTSITADTIFNTPTTSSTVGQYQINATRVLHTFGTGNTFVGASAGNFTTSGAGQNTGTGGGGVLGALTTGINNTVFGYNSGVAITTADGNDAFGRNSLVACTTGVRNSALGNGTLLSLTTGTRNLALGFTSGQNYTGSESYNVLLANQGTVGENNAFRVGFATGTGIGQLNSAFICGIQGITVTGTAVLISSSDQLGIAVSSRRYKTNIANMEDYSSDILKLRPVTFNYTVGDDHSQQSGLIAEEVNEVMPSLVVNDKMGMPQTVKYHDLPVLLLNELQKALKRIEVLEARK